MNIINIAPAQINFNSRHALTFRVPGKNGTTLVSKVKIGTPKRRGSDENIINISCDVMSKGKVCENLSFQNKKGFDPERLACICEKLQERVQEGFDYLDELFKACASRFED